MERRSDLDSEFRLFRASSVAPAALRAIKGRVESMKKGIVAPLMAALLLSSSQPLFSASREQQIVTRVDTATVMLKHRTLVIQALGMGRIPTSMGRGGWLVRRGAQAALNKDGLLEYNLMFNGVPNYS